MLDSSNVRLLIDTPSLVDLTKDVLQHSTSKLDSARAEGELGSLVSQLLEKVSTEGLVLLNPAYLGPLP
jgi:hypothetical protein